MKKRSIFIISMVIILIAIVPIFLTNEEVNHAPYKVGILISGTERLVKLEGMKKGLQDLGLVEGIHVEYIVKNSNHNMEQMRSYAIELDEGDYDVIIAGGAIEATYLKELRGSTPVVFIGVASVDELELVNNLQRPEGRMTGLDNGHTDLSGKRVQLLKMLLPETRRVIAIYDNNIEASKISLEKVKEVVKELQLKIAPISVSNESQFDALKQVSFSDNDAIVILPSYYLEKMSKEIGQLGIEKKVPIFGVNSNDVTNGILFSYGISYFDQGYQCASMISRILYGQTPTEIPVEKPDHIQLLVNGDTKEIIQVNISSIGQAYAEEIREKE